MFRHCLDGVWWVSGGCLEGVLRVSGRCLEGVWKVSGRCLEECMLGMKMVSRQYKDGI